MSGKIRPHSYPKTRQELSHAHAHARKSINPPKEDLISESDPTSNTGSDECKHSETTIEDGRNICTQCGEHLTLEYDQEQEWRYYGEHDNKHADDPSRCQYRKSPEKGIRKDLEKFNLPVQIINLADELYFEVTKGEIKRSNLRKGIMFACVFEAYKELKNPKTPEELQTMFNLDRKNMSKGITYFTLRTPNRQRYYITAEHFIPKILNMLKINDEHIQNVLGLYKEFEKRSSSVNHSNPQSISSGLVYYYLKKITADITAAKFGKIVGLSEITISRIANEIEDTLG